MTLKAILFDLDDALLATSRSGARRVRMAYDSLVEHHPGLTWSEFRTAVTTVDPAHGFWRGIGPALADLELHLSPAAGRAIGYWTFESCPELLRPSPFVRQTLRSLSSSYRLGVVTNGGSEVQRRKFTGLRLAADFQVFIASEDVGAGKPDPRIFWAALERLSVEPEEAVFVGDSLMMDVEGAHDAGMRAIWYNPSSREPGSEVAPDATIKRFNELPNVLRRMDSAGPSRL